MALISSLVANPAFWSGLGGIASAAGNLFGGNSQQQPSNNDFNNRASALDAQRAAAQQHWNNTFATQQFGAQQEQQLLDNNVRQQTLGMAQSQYDGQMAEAQRQFNANYNQQRAQYGTSLGEAQRQFNTQATFGWHQQRFAEHIAKNPLSYLISDAKANGIHPLFAMGGGLSGISGGGSIGGSSLPGAGSAGSTSLPGGMGTAQGGQAPNVQSPGYVGSGGRGGSGSPGRPSRRSPLSALGQAVTTASRIVAEEQAKGAKLDTEAKKLALLEREIRVKEGNLDLNRKMRAQFRDEPGRQAALSGAAVGAQTGSTRRPSSGDGSVILSDGRKSGGSKIDFDDLEKRHGELAAIIESVRQAPKTYKPYLDDLKQGTKNVLKRYYGKPPSGGGSW